MSDPYVSGLGNVEDIDGARVHVGVDYDTVTVGGWVRLNRDQAEEFGRLFVAAAWLAGGQRRQMDLGELERGRG